MSAPKIQMLLATQDTQTRNLVETVFEGETFKISIADSAGGIKTESMKKRYDIVLLDFDLLDEKTAEDFAESVKKAGGGYQPYMILLGKPSADTALPDALASGNILASIKKPVDSDYLTFAIRQALKIKSLNHQIKDLEQKLTGISLKDPETGLYSEQYLTERLSSEFKRANRYVYPLSVVLMEVISGASPQKENGHFNPSIVAQMGQFMMHFVRENDVVIRCEGVKFFILLPDTIKQGAMVFSQRLLHSFHRRFLGEDPKVHKSKICIGIANYPGDGVKAEDQLRDLAERALKNAKKAEGDNLYAFKGISRNDILSIVSRKK